MRTHPIGTGPFKFVEFKANESIKAHQEPRLLQWRAAALDGIEFSPSSPTVRTAILDCCGSDMTFPTRYRSRCRSVKSQAPNAVCVVEPINGLDQYHCQFVLAAVRQYRHSSRARARTRSQGLVSIMFEGQADIAAPCFRPLVVMGDAEGNAGVDPGYGPTSTPTGKSAQADAEGGLRPGTKHLAVRYRPQLPVYRDPAVILIDQIKSIYIDAELDVSIPRNGSRKSPARIMRLASTSPAMRRRSRPVVLRELFLRIGAELHKYCNREIEKLFDQQSAETTRRSQEAGLGNR